jgi:ubiquinone/menaquinone biosynthesis C-methylase UbiE
MELQILKKYAKDSQKGISIAAHHAPSCINKLEDEGFFKEITGSVLDVGCGESDIRLYVPQCRYTGLDLNFSDEFITINDWAVRGDMHDMPFDEASFDNLFVFDTLEHSIAPYVFFAEMTRVLKSKGKLFIILPNDRSGWESEPTHWFLPSWNMMVKYLTHFGFQIERFEDFPDNCWFIKAVRI